MAKKKDIELLKKNKTKKEIRELNNYTRVVVTMNTGTMAFKTPKDYDRKRSKNEVRKMIAEY